MSTPFDAAIAAIRTRGYHNHRLENHSDIVSDRLLEDMAATCPAFRRDLESGTLRAWKNVSSPGDRGRKADLLVGEPLPSGAPDMTRVRLAVENKSVITAHRNRSSRFDDLTKVMKSVLGPQPKAILVATVLVGTARRVLNVPDRILPFLPASDPRRSAVLGRLSSGDPSLFSEFPSAVSGNSATDAERSVALFRTLPVRGIAETHLTAYDTLLLVPVYVDNVHDPRVERRNDLGIDVDAEYQSFLSRTCRAYVARFAP